MDKKNKSNLMKFMGELEKEYSQEPATVRAEAAAMENDIRDACGEFSSKARKEILKLLADIASEIDKYEPNKQWDKNHVKYVILNSVLAEMLRVMAKACGRMPEPLMQMFVGLFEASLKDEAGRR